LLKQYRIEADKIVKFVLERRNKNGGFGVAAGTPPSVQDTYYALMVLKLFSDITSEDFDYDPSKDVFLKRYLSSITLDKSTRPKLLYFYIKACETAKINVSLCIFSSLPNSYEYELEDQFYLSKLTKQKIIPFRRWNTIKELSMYLKLKPDIQESQKNKLMYWILRCQNPDGGFGFLPNSTSFIENTYFALKAINLLKIERNTIQSNLSKALSFILSCYTGRGGFARKSGGAPLLEATYYSVYSLLLTDLTQKFLSHE